jgi:nucleoside-diphosphate-sugar epimerase
MMNEIIGKEVKPVHIEERPGDIKHSLSDISKATKEFGYEPKYGLEKAIGEAVEWYRDLS